MHGGASSVLRPLQTSWHSDGRPTAMETPQTIEFRRLPRPEVIGMLDAMRMRARDGTIYLVGALGRLDRLGPLANAAMRTWVVVCCQVCLWELKCRGWNPQGARRDDPIYRAAQQRYPILRNRFNIANLPFFIQFHQISTRSSEGSQSLSESLTPKAS